MHQQHYVSDDVVESCVPRNNASVLQVVPALAAGWDVCVLGVPTCRWPLLGVVARTVATPMCRTLGRDHTKYVWVGFACEMTGY